MNDHGSDAGTGLAGLRLFTWSSLTAIIVSFLLVAAVHVLRVPAPAAAKAAGLAALAFLVPATGVVFARRLTWRDGRGRPPRAWLLASAAACLVPAAVVLPSDDGGRWALVPALTVSVVVTFLPVWGRVALTAGAAAATALVGLGAGGWPRAVLFPPGLVVFSVWVTLGMLWAWDVAGRLNAARRTAAELAVAEERLRFAADLHDIQGHHLQVIALKSELAERLSGVDAEHAAAEMRDVRDLAVRALKDTRSVVQGYRRTTLDEEIANASRVLAAAGIEIRADVDAAGTARLPAETRHLLGLVMREATTNVLRHSSARSAEVGYRMAGGTARLRVGNDGSSAPAAPDGTGLRGLAERLAAAGGELSTRHEGDRFAVVASVPVPGMEPDP